MNPSVSVQSAALRILDAGKNDYGELFSACTNFYERLVRTSGLNTQEDNNRKHLSLESGEAIGLTWAAMCINDILRTKRFMDGVYRATCDILESNAGRAVHILYTGTGPFAALVVPLTARFGSRQVQFSLLEVNESSFNHLQHLVKTLQLEKYIRRMEKADGVKWKLPPEEPVDIFICETMQQGLKTEPQVAIFMNIVPQLPPGTIIIPEGVSLKAALINTRKRMQNKTGPGSYGNGVHPLGTVFTLNKETIMKHAARYQHAGAASYCFPETVTLPIPPEVADSHPVLYLLTDITIYKADRLLMDESALTLPLKLADFSRSRPAEIKFQYCTGNKPGMQFTCQET